VVSRDVPDTVCVQVPKTECATVTRQVPETVCTPKPVTKCAAVPFPVTVQVPVERCDPVARQVCHPAGVNVRRVDDLFGGECPLFISWVGLRSVTLCS
jgi:hypothetical protein